MRALILSLILSSGLVLLGACTGATSGALPTLATTNSATPDATPVATTESETAAVEQVYARWRTAVETADIPAYVTALHPEVRMFPPGAPVVAGSDSYAAFLGPVFEAADYKIEVSQLPQVELVGDLAIAEYEYIIHLKLKDKNAGVTEPGALTANRTRTRYVDVLRKTPAGNWGVWRHTWSVLPE